MVEIKNRFTGAVLFRSETAETLRAAVVEAISARANLADADLADANLADANLAGANLAGANLAGANLADADLAGANLAGAYLAGADLAGANLAGAYLAGAYLAGAYLAGAYLAQARGLPVGRFTPDPEQPYVYQGKSSAEGRAERAKRYREANPDVPVVEALDRKILDVITTGGGKLEMGAWHSCETTHCRAGWAIHLAGAAGYDLEKKLGDPQLAGRAIYLASTGRSPHFFASNEAAFADIKRCAEEQAAQDEGA